MDAPIVQGPNRATYRLIPEHRMHWRPDPPVPAVERESHAGGTEIIVAGYNGRSFPSTRAAWEWAHEDGRLGSPGSMQPAYKRPRVEGEWSAESLAAIDAFLAAVEVPCR